MIDKQLKAQHPFTVWKFVKNVLQEKAGQKTELQPAGIGRCYEIY